MNHSESSKPVTPRRAPGPKGLPILGQALRYQKDPFGFFLWLRENFGDVVEDPSSGIPLVQIFTPEAIEHVLVRNAKNYQKDRIIRSWNLLFGEGLLISEGEKWKRDRRVIQPAFHRDRIAEYQAQMEHHTLRLSQSLRWSSTRGGSSQINIVSEMTELTMRIAIESLFGMEPNAEVSEKDFQEIAGALDDIAQWFEFSSGAFMILSASFPWFPFPKKLRYQSAISKLEKILLRIISRKRELLAHETHPHLDLLGALIQAKEDAIASSSNTENAFSDRQIRDQALTFFLAGHETTSLALTYTLRLLALHPEIQEQLRTLLMQGPSEEARFTLDQVIDEAMRLYPPAALTARESLGEDQIGGFFIRKGTTVVIPTWAIHRDPRYFGEDVEIFRPSRWTQEFRKELPRAAYLPFGFGPRMCIGFGFALQEMRIILAHLISNYRFTINRENVAMKLQSSITMRPVGPVLLEVTAVH